MIVNGALSLGSNLTLNVADYYDPNQLLPPGQYDIMTVSGGITGLLRAHSPSTASLRRDGHRRQQRRQFARSQRVGHRRVDGRRLPGLEHHGRELEHGRPKYCDGDAVRFDDSGLAAAIPGSVTISGTVQPSVITVANNVLTYTFSGNGRIGGATSLVVQGSGQLNMNMPNNTYTGGTALNSGVLQIDVSSTVIAGTLAKGPLGTGLVALSGGTLQDDGNGRTLANAVLISGPCTLAGLTLGPQALATPNAVTLSGAPTINVTAPVTIDDPIVGDTLVMAGPSTLTITSPANGFAAAQVSGGTLVGTVASIPTAVVLSNNADVTYEQETDDTLNRVVSGTGWLTKDGAGVLTIGTPQMYEGVTKVVAGTLKQGVAVGLPSDTEVQVAPGATFDLNGYPAPTGGLSNDPGGGMVTNSVPGTVALTLSPTGTASFSGVIQDGPGHIAVTINGPGIQILAGGNTYTAGTTLNGGVLQIGVSSTVSAGTLAKGPLGTGSVVLSGGTLQDDGGPHAGQRRAHQRPLRAGRPDPRPGQQLGDARHVQHGNPQRRTNDQRHRAGDHRRPGVRQPDHGGLQHADPHRDCQWPDRHHPGQRRHVGGDRGQHRHAGRAVQRRRRDLRSGDDATLDQVVSGDGSLTKDGSGNLTITSGTPQTYDGITKVRAVR